MVRHMFGCLRYKFIIGVAACMIIRCFLDVLLRVSTPVVSVSVAPSRFLTFPALATCCEVIVLATLQTLFSERWTILARFVTICFSAVATHLSRLLPFLLCLWPITFGVRSACFRLFPTSEFVISFVFFYSLTYSCYFMVVFHIFDLLSNIFALTGFFDKLF